MKFTRIPRNRDLHKKRTAAYCRVSTQLKEQEDSFETQLNYYTTYIKSNDNWEFAGIYFDEKSGTKADNREGFQKLIHDALDGKVDYILVKSISRFSRNLVDCQKYVNLLHGNGVDIKFEKENLDTADPSCSMMLSFLATIAQDESHSISENVKWGYRQRYKRGEYNLGNNRILGYDTIDGKLVPNKDAHIVSLIFQMYYEGNTLTDITRTLDSIGALGLKKKKMTISSIRYILTNETYVGDKHLQKQAPRNFLTKKPDKNTIYQSNYLTNDHEAIISREIWDTVQQKLAQHQEEVKNGSYHDGRTHFLHGRIFCGHCGAMFTRRTVRHASRTVGHSSQTDRHTSQTDRHSSQTDRHASQTDRHSSQTDSKKTRKIWTCKERHKGRRGNGCQMRNIPEEELMRAIRTWMNLADDEDFPIERFRGEIAGVVAHEWGLTPL